MMHYRVEYVRSAKTGRTRAEVCDLVTGDIAFVGPYAARPLAAKAAALRKLTRAAGDAFHRWHSVAVALELAKADRSVKRNR